VLVKRPIARLGENVDLIDSDHDGTLTREEMRAGRSKMRPESAGQKASATN
jgi:hypothetical protein